MPPQVVVIGAGVGGLSAAIHSRLLGYEVLVVEKQAYPGGKAAGQSIDGYRLDPGPSIIILKRLYESLFRAANRKPEDYLCFRRLDPFTRVSFEGQEPLELPADREECLSLLAERFPVDGARVRGVMERADRIIRDVDKTIFDHPFDYPWQFASLRMMRIGNAFGGQKKYKEVVDDWFKSPELRAFFYGFPSYGGQTFDSVAPGAFLIPYLMLSEGVFYPEGGVAAIPKALHRLALELGVEFRFDCRILGLERRDKRITSVVAEDGSIECDAVICNVDRLAAGTWLGRTFDPAPSLSYFTVHWGLTQKHQSLQCHNLFIPKDFEQGFEELYRQRRFPASPIVYVNATSAVDPDVAPSGASNLFAVATSPAMTDSLDWARLTPFAKDAVMTTLSRCGLDVNPSEIAFEQIQSPLTFAERDGNYRGSLYGADEVHRLFGFMPQRNWDEEFRNLLYCGGSVQPGAGLPMVLLSGKFAAERLSRA